MAVSNPLGFPCCWNASLQGWAEQAAADCTNFRGGKWSCLHPAVIPEGEELLHRGKKSMHKNTVPNEWNISIGEEST